MIYLKAIGRYLVKFLKTLGIFIVFLLFYFFIMILSQKLGGAEDFFKASLMNFLGLLLNSLPFILIISTGLYFAFSMNFDKRFAVRVIPIISAINSLFLIGFFFVQLDFDALPDKEKFTTTPQLEEGHINPLHGYNIYVNDLNDFNTDEILEGILFYDKAYFIDSGEVTTAGVSIATTKYIGDNSIVSRSGYFSIPQDEVLYQIEDTGLYRLLMEYYISFIKRIQNIFFETFTSENVLFSVAAILLMGMGFFNIISGISFFLNDKEIFILSASALVLISIGGFISFQYFLSLIEVIKFGIANAIGKLILPSATIALIAWLIGFGMVQLKDALQNKKNGRAA